MLHLSLNRIKTFCERCVNSFCKVKNSEPSVKVDWGDCQDEFFVHHSITNNICSLFLTKTVAKRWQMPIITIPFYWNMFIKNTKFRCPANFERHKLLNDDTKEDAIASVLKNLEIYQEEEDEINSFDELCSRISTDYNEYWPQTLATLMFNLKSFVLVKIRIKYKRNT